MQHASSNGSCWLSLQIQDQRQAFFLHLTRRYCSRRTAKGIHAHSIPYGTQQDKLRSDAHKASTAHIFKQQNVITVRGVSGPAIKEYMTLLTEAKGLNDDIKNAARSEGISSDKLAPHRRWTQHYT